MSKVNKGDFVQIDYTAKIKDGDIVFDTTLESDAKKHGIHNPKVTYKPLVIKAGEGQLVKGLDAFIVDKTPGNYTVELDADNAFGKKNAKLLRLVSVKEFHKNQINPMPGLEVDLDGNRGVVRTVNGGRVIVDFNHPLSSRDITYELQIKGVVEDPKLKVEAALGMFRIPFESVNFENDTATVVFKNKIPEEVAKPITEELKKLTNVKNIEFK
ncbi:MAG TPA: FKBP-type peptidyl-prolyl cis-trans isomerase [Alphaproteobacteria bacterium]|nr:FKBP-type peptidyl-prolyl cis-trans isomerase [Alphaproteobacteria bacterium]